MARRKAAAAPAALCTPAQYVERFGPVADEGALSECLLDATAAVIAEVESAGIDWEGDGAMLDRMMRVTRNVARRAQESDEDVVPFGASQFSQTTGPYNRQFTMGNPYGDMFLTASDRRLLGTDAQTIGTLRPLVGGDGCGC